MDPTFLRLIGLRLLAIPLSLLVVATFAFALVALIPGDPAVQILGQFATPEELDRLRAELGLDRTAAERYVIFIGHLLEGDLGTSFQSRRPVLEEIGRHLPATVELVVLATFGAVAIGLVMGGIGAWYRGRWPDRVASGGITLFQSIPDFLLALLLIFALFFVLRLVPPPVGRLGFGASAPPAVTGMLLVDSLLAGQYATFRRVAAASLLPVLALSVVYSAYIAKISRTTISAALNSDQALYARACGLSEWKVFGYALKQARTPILTYGAILFGSLIGGAAIIETIFAWPGMGRLYLLALGDYDYPVAMSIFFIIAILTVIATLLRDILYTIVDPRIRLS